MDKKKLRWSSLGGDVVDIKEKRKAAQQPPIDINWITPYWLERDRIIYRTADEETKKEILRRYGK